jgi:hypothetical protein
MPSVEYDLRYLRAALVDLEGYLFSKEIYWPIGIKPPHGDPPYPRLTLGGILISRQSLTRRSMQPAQEEEVTEVIHRLETTKNKWLIAWGSKAARSFTARLNLWSNFIEDYRKQPENNMDRYAYEARGRVILQLLQSESDEIHPAEIGLVKELDRVLKAYFMKGNFLWDLELIDCFPKDQFWYLYGYLKESVPMG